MGQPSVKTTRTTGRAREFTTLNSPDGGGNLLKNLFTQALIQVFGLR